MGFSILRKQGSQRGMRHGFFVCLLTLCAACQTARPVDKMGQAYQQTLTQQLDALLAAQDPGVQMGVHLVRASTGEVLYSRNATQRFTPASTLKLFTAATALATLGPTYRFATTLSADSNAQVVKGALPRLYLRGSGDPSLTQWDLTRLAATLAEQGVRQISQEIVVDDSAFVTERWGHGWMWDDLRIGYSATVGALNVDENAFVIAINPNLRPGAPATLTMTPHTDVFAVRNNVMTTLDANNRGITVTLTGRDGGPTDAMGLNAQDVITLTGTMAVGSATQYRSFAVKDPSAYTAQLLQEALGRVGIVCSKNIRVAQVPVGSRTLAEHQSVDVATLVRDFLKASDDPGMEVLLKAAGAQAWAQPGSAAGGLDAIRLFLRNEVGVAPTDIAIHDGSGLSRYSLVSPLQLTALLQAARANFAIGPEFVAALPVGGLDGTLRDRYKAPLMRGRVRAKTGSFTGVVTLAGYLETPGGEVVTFALMMQGIVGRLDAYRGLQEQILTWVNDLQR